MRIISGKYRGRKLISPTNKDIRPTSDMIKEAIFGMIQFEINDSVFFDMFAGSGSIGIEALSRGAKKVYFCDKSKDSVILVKKNLEAINVSADNYEIFNGDFLQALDRFKNYKFDFIFIDPPYTDKTIDIILDKIFENKMLTEDGKIFYEQDSKTSWENVSQFMNVVKRKYGKTTINIIKH